MCRQRPRDDVDIACGFEVGVKESAMRRPAMRPRRVAGLVLAGAVLLVVAGCAPEVAETYGATMAPAQVCLDAAAVRVPFETLQAIDLATTDGGTLSAAIDDLAAATSALDDSLPPKLAPVMTAFEAEVELLGAAVQAGDGPIDANRAAIEAAMEAVAAKVSELEGKLAAECDR